MPTRAFLGFAAMTVMPGPNRFVVIDVPIVPGGVVEGAVFLETAAGRQHVGSAQLTLLDRRTGAARALTTFGDGEFSAVAVRPGGYDVLVDVQLLARLGATAAPVRFVLPADPDGASVTGIEVVLSRSASADAESDAHARVPPPAAAPVSPAVPPPGPPASSAPPSPPLRGSGAPSQSGPTAAPRAGGQPPLRYTTYTVRRHDTLRRIARRLLGDEARWVEIYRANRALIEWPNLIHPGQRLRVDLRQRGRAAR